MAKKAETPDPSKQSIEELQTRYNVLHTKKIEAQTNLQNATQRLNELKDDAREKYGTDDVEKLREKLTEMTAENERKRSSYQAELDRIENGLQEVEQKFAPSEEQAAKDEEQL